MKDDMPQNRSSIQAKPGDVLLMIGTTKGAFLFRSNASRTRWQASGPHFAGASVYAMAFDGREHRHRLWASSQSPPFGCTLQSSDDFGRTWSNSEVPLIQFPADTNVALKNIWQIAPGPASQPGTLYCGV